MTIFDLFQDERRYGWVVDKRYDWINMLSKMRDNNPQRFEEFQYTNATIYHYIDRVQMEQTHE
jgi:hypothetical protein